MATVVTITNVESMWSRGLVWGCKPTETNKIKHANHLLAKQRRKAHHMQGKHFIPTQR